jgi:hypothetical protein
MVVANSNQPVAQKTVQKLKAYAKTFNFNVSNKLQGNNHQQFGSHPNPHPTAVRRPERGIFG